MAGNRIGGLKAVKTIKERYGEWFYFEIGVRGGRASRGGGFGQGEEGRERARAAGRIGGKISKRGPSEAKKRDTSTGVQHSGSNVARR